MNDDREHFVPHVRGSIAVAMHELPPEATVTIEWSTSTAGWDPACLTAMDTVEENAAARGWRTIKRHMECKDLARMLLRKSGTWAWAKELARSVYGPNSELRDLGGQDTGTHVTDIKLERS